MANLAAMMPDFFKQDLFVGCDKQTQVDFGNGQILANLNLGNGDQCPFEQIPALLLENDAQILLDQT
jgi:hypothetical protein